MARKLKEDTEVARNNEELEKLIKEGVDQIIAYETQISGIQSKIKEVRGSLKGQGIKMKDLAIAKRLYELDDDDRRESMDTIRLCFAALGIGEQGDMFPKDGEE